VANPNPTSIDVRVGKAWVSQPVAPGFIGFSFEFTAVRDYTGSDPRAINPVLVALIRDVAPGQTPVLRIGGNSTDGTWWPLPGVTPSPGITYTLTKSWLATTRALAVATGAKLILGVNMKDDSAAEAAAEAHAYRAGIGSKHIEALEIGNEPELYKVFPWYEINGEPFYARPPIYNFTSYTEEIAEIAGQVRGFALAGPATGTPQWFAAVPQLFHVEHRLKVVTYHRYPLLACFSQPGDPRYPSIPNLLNPDSARDLLTGAGDTIAYAHKHGATVRIDELNSVACAGQPGVSDTFASALWATGYITQVMAAGVAGINLQGNPANCAGYTPLCAPTAAALAAGGLRAQPEWYALLLSRSLVGDRPLPSTISVEGAPGENTPAESAPAASTPTETTPGEGSPTTSSPDLVATAFAGPGHTLKVVLVNDEPQGTSPLELHLDVGAGLGAAEILRLTAPSPSATGDVLLAGRAVAANGSWSAPAGTPSVATHAGILALELPPSSAALVTVSPPVKRRPVAAPRRHHARARRTRYTSVYAAYRRTRHSRRTDARGTRGVR
jgi:hypothetical protein